MRKIIVPKGTEIRLVGRGNEIKIISEKEMEFNPNDVQSWFDQRFGHCHRYKYNGVLPKYMLWQIESIYWDVNHSLIVERFPIRSSLII